jgi:preprotein translocase subunit SecD
MLVACLGQACSVLRRRQALTWSLTLEVPAETPNLPGVLTETRKTIERRLDNAGVPGFDVQTDTSASNRIVIHLPSVQDPERVKRLVSTQGRLELLYVFSPPNPAVVQTFASTAEALETVKTLPPDGWKVLPYVERFDSQNSARFVIVKLPPVVDGREISKASAVLDHSQDYYIAFTLNRSGAEKLGSWTATHINDYLAVAYNDEIRSIAFIKSQIFDNGQITGRFTKSAAEELAQILKSGPLPVPVKLVAETTNK